MTGPSASYSALLPGVLRIASATHAFGSVDIAAASTTALNSCVIAFPKSVAIPASVVSVSGVVARSMEKTSIIFQDINSEDSTVTALTS